MHTVARSNVIRSVVLLSLVLLGAAALAAVAVPPRHALAASTLRLLITGAGTVTEITDARRMNCSSPDSTPSGDEGMVCTAAYDWLWPVRLRAAPAAGYTFGGWQR